ncbi:MAG: putative DNA-binding protein [Ruminococcus sp.]|nr:putative DNA-binding protein [Ruminococcus sp.]
MPKNLEYGLLLDVYGGLLTEKQLEMMQLYYDEDLSLSEIGEQYGISRQGVHDSLKRSEQALDEFEERLGILKARRVEIDALLSIKKDALEALDQCRKVSFGKNIADKVIKTLENIDSRLAELGEEQE